MGHGNFTGNIQTQAGTGCGALRIFPAIEPLKNATLLIPGNRAAIVRDPDRNELTLAFDRNQRSQRLTSSAGFRSAFRLTRKYSDGIIWLHRFLPL